MNQHHYSFYRHNIDIFDFGRIIAGGDEMILIYFEEHHLIRIGTE